MHHLTIILVLAFSFMVMRYVLTRTIFIGWMGLEFLLWFLVAVVLSFWLLPFR